jgi:hypothetical protein
MIRGRALMGIGLVIALAGCTDTPSTPRAGTAAPVASVLSPVPEEAPPQPPGAAPRPRRTSPAPTPTATAKRAAEADSGVTGFDRFVAAVQQQLPAVALDRRDEEVEALGEQACDSLAAGRKAAAVAGEISSEGVAAPDARKLVTLAGTTACPSRPKV